jgi:hypothetical protein
MGDGYEDKTMYLEHADADAIRRGGLRLLQNNDAKAGIFDVFKIRVMGNKRGIQSDGGCGDY